MHCSKAKVGHADQAVASLTRRTIIRTADYLSVKTGYDQQSVFKILLPLNSSWANLAVTD
jgi:hypothetical protein